MNRAYLNRIVRLSGGAFARGIGGEDWPCGPPPAGIRGGKDGTPKPFFTASR